MDVAEDIVISMGVCLFPNLRNTVGTVFQGANSRCANSMRQMVGVHMKQAKALLANVEHGVFPDDQMPDGTPPTGVMVSLRNTK